MTITAIMTQVEMSDKSLPPRFQVGVERSDGARIVRFLLDGPFYHATANEKRDQIQHSFDNGSYRDPWMYPSDGPR